MHRNTTLVEMPKSCKAPPAFYKIMVGDFLNKVCIPRAFIKNFHGNIPKKVTLTSPSGKLFSASIKQIGEDWFLCKKWSVFAEEHGLKYQEFLVFKLSGHVGFNVTIYKKNALEKVLPLPPAETAIVESNFNSVEKKQDREMAEKPIVEAPVLHEIKKDEADSPEKIITVDPPPMPMRSDVMNTARFTTTLGRSATYQLSLPRKFARENGFTERKSVRLVDQLGESWLVKVIRSKNGNTILSSGWNLFTKAKKLRARDTCEFEYDEGVADALRVNIIPEVESKETSVPEERAEVPEGITA